MNSILLFSLPIFLSLLLFGLQHLAPTLPSALQTPYPVEADLLKNHVGGRHHTLPEGGTMEYYTLFNPNKSPPNTPKTTILALHPSWGTGMGLCRLKFEGVLKILELMKGREVNLLCPTMPGWGTSESYEAFLSGEEYRKQYLKSVADLIGSQSEGVTEIKVLAWEDAAGLVPDLLSHFATSTPLKVSSVALVSPVLHPLWHSGLGATVDTVIRYYTHAKDKNPFTGKLNRGKSFKALKEELGETMSGLVRDASRATHWVLFSRVVDVFTTLGNVEGGDVQVYCQVNDEGCVERYKKLYYTKESKLMKFEHPSKLGIPIEQIVFNLGAGEEGRERGIGEGRAI